MNKFICLLVVAFSFVSVASANDVVCQAPVKGVYQCQVESQHYECVVDGAEFVCNIVLK